MTSTSEPEFSSILLLVQERWLDWANSKIDEN